MFGIWVLAKVYKMTKDIAKKIKIKIALYKIDNLAILIDNKPQKTI